MTPFAEQILQATGFLADDGQPADGLVLPGHENVMAGDAARLGTILSRRAGGLAADAVFRVGSSPVVIFKSASTGEDEVAWHRLAWNTGVAPLLWVTTPRYVRLYNAYRPPTDYDGTMPLIAEFLLGDAVDAAFDEIKAACGRQHFAMGSFWRSELAVGVDRRGRVDSVLLDELGALLQALSGVGLKPSLAQKLVGRCIFFQYLVHRGYLREEELADRFGASTLDQILTNIDKTYRLFRWLRQTFNGDLFPIEDEASERAQVEDAHRLAPLADFFGYFNIRNKQGRLFPFRFDAIPVELISSIYEKFVHMADTDGAPRQGVHYTPMNLVDLVLDPVFENLTAEARVLDPACGSGVFLVESLRRLVWLRSREHKLDRALIRETLFTQVKGVDVSPAALSVAAFSLYLALLELDPSPPTEVGELDCLKFDPLRDRVLFEASAFDPKLAERMSGGAAPVTFDLIVGNPPWTYRPEEKRADRDLKAVVSSSLEAAIEKSPRSGWTFARLNKRPVPARSPDWAFLWRAHDFCHADTRIALVMKATPFLSQSEATRKARDAILRAFPNVTLVNLSQLRMSRLFQEYEADEGADDERTQKANAGPALIFLSNCQALDDGKIALINFPWSSTFQRTGVFEQPAEGPATISLDRARDFPGSLKAAMFGTERDAWFIERLTRNPGVMRLRDWLTLVDLPAGQGYQAGTLNLADYLTDRPVATARDIAFGRIAEDLNRFEGDRAHRPRPAEIYEGPLVLLPEGALTRSPVLGRYTAAFDRRSLVYTESFVGVSFRGHPDVHAKAFAAVMHSSLVALQLALSASTVGVKQTKIEAVDLYELFVPTLNFFSGKALGGLADAYDALCAGSDDNDEREVGFAAQRIDAILAEALGLNSVDTALLSDAARRAGAIMFETDTTRRALEEAPTVLELEAYANNMCAIFNASALEDDDLRLHSIGHALMGSDLVISRFDFLTAAEIKSHAWAPDRGLIEAAIKALGGFQLPYLKPTKALRLYVDESLFVLKPAHYRYFSPSAGQSDADHIVADLMMQSASAGSAS